MGKKYHLKTREFLSEDSEYPAYIVAVVEDTRGRRVKGETDIYQELHLRISDGSKDVWLGFDLESVEACEDSLRQIRTLANVVNNFLQAVEREVEVITARSSVQQHARAAAAVH